MAEKESNFTGWLNEKILPKVGKFANTRFVRAVMGAGYSIIAFTIVGSMFLILSVLTQVITLPAFVDFYNNTLGRFNNLFTVIYNATLGIIAIFFTGSFAYNYTKIYQQEEKLDLNPLNGAFLALFALFITVPQLVWKHGSAQFLTDKECRLQRLCNQRLRSFKNRCHGYLHRSCHRNSSHSALSSLRKEGLVPQDA